MKKIKVCILTLIAYLLISVIIYFICNLEDVLFEPINILLFFVILIIAGSILYFLLSQKYKLFWYITWSIAALYPLWLMIYYEFFVHVGGGFISFDILTTASQGLYIISLDLGLLFAALIIKLIKKIINKINQKSISS